MSTFSTIAELLAEISAGRMVILADDENRENEGDLVMAADCVSAEHINFMARHARGLICLALSPERCRQLDLPLMVSRSRGRLSTNFTVSIDAAQDVGTGISTADRARTVQAAVARDAKPEDLLQPGHIFPLRAEAGGVLTRAGHTEAGCDLARLAGFEPAAVIVEIMKDDGTMARRTDLEAFAAQHNLCMGTIADLVEYRMLHEKTVERVSEGQLTTRWGDFKCYAYRDSPTDHLHLALVRGTIHPDTPVPVRVHVPETMRDLIGVDSSQGTGWNVSRCLEHIDRANAGILVLIGREQTPDEILYHMGLATGQDLSPPRTVGSITALVGIGAQILRDLGVGRMSLMARQVRYTISGFGLEVDEYLESPEEAGKP